MSKTKQKGRNGSKKGRELNAGAHQPAAGSSAAPDAPSLIGESFLTRTSGRQLTPSEKAHILLAQSNFELAIKFLQRALSLDAANLEGRELLGIAELEGGDADAGREVRSTSTAELQAPS